MGPKDKPSKKAVLKKNEKVIEDRTFGLKNKNKSKKVQSFIEGIIIVTFPFCTIGDWFLIRC
jgi:hypothetical protein